MHHDAINLAITLCGSRYFCNINQTTECGMVALWLRFQTCNRNVTVFTSSHFSVT